MLGPGEFAEGLGLGLKSFFGGTFGNLYCVPALVSCNLL